VVLTDATSRHVWQQVPRDARDDGRVRIEEALRVSGAAPMAAGLRERQELYKKGEAYRSGSRR